MGPAEGNERRLGKTLAGLRVGGVERGEMQDELQQAIETGKLTAKAAAALEALAPGTFCQHKDWGFGRVAEWDLLAGSVTVDFASRKGHRMQAGYAAESLKPIPHGHILARRESEPEAVRAQAAEDPLALARAVIADFGGKATAAQITAALTPKPLDAAAFKKWWDAARKKMKTDGHFVVGAKKNDPFVLLDKAVDPAMGLVEQFRSARFLKAQIAALDQIARDVAEGAVSAGELQSLVKQVEESAQKGSRLQPAQALELMIARDEIVARHPGLAAGPFSAADILKAEQSRVSELFAALPAAKQRRALEYFPAAFGESALDIALRLAKQAPARLIVEISKFLAKAGHGEAFRAAVGRWVGDRSVSTEMLIWLARERGADFPELFNPDLLNAIFSGLERDMLDEKRGSRLQDLLLSDLGLLAELLESAEIDGVRDAMRRLILTPVFADLDKRSLIGRIVKLYPELQSMIAGDEETRDESLTVSWASLEARKAAYERLITVEIPQNTKDIQVAREQGDLRENFGFKAAKEQQRVLMRRRAEMERDLALARGTNFENPDTSQVSIGTVVELAFDDGTTESYSILGAWDSVPEKHIVSYQAGIGQALLGKKPGDPVEIAGEHGRRKANVASIRRFTDLDLLVKA